MYRLFLLPVITEEDFYRGLHVVLQLSSLSTSPDMEAVTKDLLTLWRQGNKGRREGDLLEVEKTGADTKLYPYY